MEYDALFAEDVAEAKNAVDVRGQHHQIDIVIPGNQLTVSYRPQQGAVGQRMPDSMALECAVYELEAVGERLDRNGFLLEFQGLL